MILPRRLFWFTAGVASGALGAAYGYARLREVRGQVAADQLADTAARVARRMGGTVRDVVTEGLDAMRDADPGEPPPGLGDRAPAPRRRTSTSGPSGRSPGPTYGRSGRTPAQRVTPRR